MEAGAGGDGRKGGSVRGEGEREGSVRGEGEMEDSEKRGGVVSERGVQNEGGMGYAYVYRILTTDLHMTSRNQLSDLMQPTCTLFEGATLRIHIP